MRRAVAAVILLSCAASVARAQPGDVLPPPASGSSTPWVDQQPPAPVVPGVPAVTADGNAAIAPPNLTLQADPNAPNAQTGPAAEPVVHHPRAAVATLAGLYAGFTGWMYYAWYRKHKPLSQYKFGGDGWLGDETYAGGADKFGHVWATMSLARLGTWILSDVGGFDHTKSTLLATGLSELLFIGVEVKDGFFYEFSFSDISGDTTGMALALLFELCPRLDEMFDYRVQYFPSRQYWDQVSGTSGAPLGGKLNIAEDYSGETYLLAYHLGSIHSLREIPTWGTLASFVDVVGGFDSRGYKPEPASGELPPSDHHQNLFVGVSFNAQGFFDWLFTGPTHHNTIRTITHGMFEVFNLPYTSTPLLQYSHSPSGEPNQDGA